MALFSVLINIVIKCILLWPFYHKFLTFIFVAGNHDMVSTFFGCVRFR